jgi:hypothetical protein
VKTAMKETIGRELILHRPSQWRHFQGYAYQYFVAFRSPFLTLHTLILARSIRARGLGLMHMQYSILQLDLPTFALLRGFSTGIKESGATPTHALEMEPIPGRPDTVAVVLGDRGSFTRYDGFALFENGVKRLSTPAPFLPRPIQANHVEATDNSRVLYGLETLTSRISKIESSQEQLSIVEYDQLAPEKWSDMVYPAACCFRSTGRRTTRRPKH